MPPLGRMLNQRSSCRDIAQFPIQQNRASNFSMPCFVTIFYTASHDASLTPSDLLKFFVAALFQLLYVGLVDFLGTACDFDRLLAALECSFLHGYLFPKG